LSAPAPAAPPPWNDDDPATGLWPPARGFPYENDGVMDDDAFSSGVVVRLLLTVLFPFIICHPDPANEEGEERSQ
jgi:hypothetical protein